MQVTNCSTINYDLLRISDRTRLNTMQEFKATITAIDRASSTADITYSTTASELSLPTEDVPFFYHCPWSSGTAESAMYYGNLAFDIGDVVIVRYLPADGEDSAETYIVGHADHPDLAPCPFEKIVIRLELVTDEYCWAFPDLDRTWITVFDPIAGQKLLADPEDEFDLTPVFPVIVDSADSGETGLITEDEENYLLATYEEAITGELSGDWTNPTAVHDTIYWPTYTYTYIDLSSATRNQNTLQNTSGSDLQLWGDPNVIRSNAAFEALECEWQCSWLEQNYTIVQYSPGENDYSHITDIYDNWSEYEFTNNLLSSGDPLITDLSEYTGYERTSTYPADEDKASPSWLLFDGTCTGSEYSSSGAQIYEYSSGTAARHTEQYNYPTDSGSLYYFIGSTLDGVFNIADYRELGTYTKYTLIEDGWVDVSGNLCEVTPYTYYRGKQEKEEVTANYKITYEYTAPWDTTVFSTREHQVTYRKHVSHIDDDDGTVSQTTEEYADVSLGCTGTMRFGDKMATGFYVNFGVENLFYRYLDHPAGGSTSDAWDVTLTGKYIDISPLQALAVDTPDFLTDNKFTLTRVQSSNNPSAAFEAAIYEIYDTLLQFLWDNVFSDLTDPADENYVNFMAHHSITPTIYAVKEI